jgi:hypothetical protein
VAGVAAMYSWFITAEVSADAVWYAPVLLPLLGFLRSYATFHRIGEIGTYLRDFEEKIQWSGWERTFAQKAKSHQSITSFIFFIILLVCTVVAPRYLH